MSEIDVLYHIKSTSVDFQHDPSGTAQKVEIAGTYTDLAEAKEAAKVALFDLGYPRDSFETYQLKSDTPDWKFGDGVFVHALAKSGEDFKVGIETTPNTLNLQPGSGTSRVKEKLFYVIQTTIFFNEDRSGRKRDVIMLGVYLSRTEANEIAKQCLLEPDLTKEIYFKYEEFTGQSDWQFGSAVVVHAVAHNGEHYLVGVIPPE